MKALAPIAARNFRSLLASAFVFLIGCSSDKPVSPGARDAFMEQWGEYEAFKVPMDPMDEPLLLAALEKDPRGPWVHYIMMKFAQVRHDERACPSR